MNTILLIWILAILILWMIAIAKKNKQIENYLAENIELAWKNRDLRGKNRRLTAERNNGIILLEGKDKELNEFRVKLSNIAVKEVKKKELNKLTKTAKAEREGMEMKNYKGFKVKYIWEDSIYFNKNKTYIATPGKLNTFRVENNEWTTPVSYKQKNFKIVEEKLKNKKKYI